MLAWPPELVAVGQPRSEAEVSVRASTGFFLYEFVWLFLNFHKGFVSTAPSAWTSKCIDALCEGLPPWPLV